MNVSNYKLCDKIIPASYVRQGLEARKVLENRVMQLLEQACTCTFLSINFCTADESGRFKTRRGAWLRGD